MDLAVAENICVSSRTGAYAPGDATAAARPRENPREQKRERTLETGLVRY
jgi:hypothetical protein